MNWKKIIKEMEVNSYPPNQFYDPSDIENLIITNKRIKTIHHIFPEIEYGFDSLLDVGCNKGLFSFAFKDCFKEIIGIDPIRNMIDIAQEIKNAYELQHISFFNIPFEKFYTDIMFDIVHFGQCAHYLFRDAVRKCSYPLTFLEMAKEHSKKYILVDGAFEGDPSVEFDAKEDKWPQSIKEMATIEGYAKALRPEFRLIKYGWSGDGATRFLAVFERTS